MPGPKSFRSRVIFENHGTKLAKWYERWLIRRRLSGSKPKRPVFNPVYIAPEGEETYDRN